MSLGKGRKTVALVVAMALALASFPSGALLAAPRTPEPPARRAAWALLLQKVALRLPVPRLRARARRPAEIDKLRSGEAFEASAARPELSLPETLSVAPPSLERLTTTAPLKLARGPRPARGRDEHRGPPPLKLNRVGQTLYGLRWGVHLLGLSVLAEIGVGALAQYFQWPLNLPTSLLGAVGRAQLMVPLGPGTLSQILEARALLFYAAGIPALATMEEIIFRGVQFGLSFYALSALGSAASKAREALRGMPDIFLWKTTAEKALSLASLFSREAYTLAALLSALSFAAAHFPLWGIEPVTFSQHLVLGLALAHVAYSTKSLIAPISAHASYNALSLLPQALGLGGTDEALMLHQLLGVGALTVLYYFIRSGQGVHRLWPAALLALLLFAGPRLSPPQAAPPSATSRPTAAAPAEPPKASPKQALSDEQAVALAKPATLRLETEGGVGSGTIISPEGLALTNAHVAAEAGQGGKIRILLTDGQELEGVVLDFNEDKDIALIQLPSRAGGWPFLALADPAALAEGQRVLALGYPKFQPFSASAGIISGIGGRHNGSVGYIQTDAAVNPGNSGGPLINNKGDLVGLNTWKLSDSEGLNFAIASEDLSRALAQYRALGHLRSPWLGIIVDQSRPDDGLRVETARPGSPAARAGLEPEDLILSAGGKAFPRDGEEAFRSLETTMSSLRPGDRLVLRIARQGNLIEKQVVLGEKP